MAGFSEFVGTFVPLTEWAGSITAKYWLEVYTQAARSERRRRKIFQLKNTFADGNGIAGLDKKTSASPFREALGIHFENLVSTRFLSSHRNSFRRSNARISAGHGDRLQQVDTARTAI